MPSLMLFHDKLCAPFMLSSACGRQSSRPRGGRCALAGRAANYPHVEDDAPRPSWLKDSDSDSQMVPALSAQRCLVPRCALNTVGGLREALGKRSVRPESATPERHRRCPLARNACLRAKGQGPNNRACGGGASDRCPWAAVRSNDQAGAGCPRPEHAPGERASGLHQRCPAARRALLLVRSRCPLLRWPISGCGQVCIGA